MAKKIIMILSLLSNSSNPIRYTYSCPNGRLVDGALSNEPTVKYLLDEYPDISEILCICTPQATEQSWDYFNKCINDYLSSKKIDITQIEYKNEEITFENGPLVEILSKTTSGDEILIETSGGQRNDIMSLIFITRVLSYTGVSTLRAVYSQLSTKEVKDVTNIINMFDLVEGVQDLTSFGNINRLRKYYGSPACDERIEALIVAVEQLVESISLCHADKIDGCMNDLNSALNNAQQCGDPLMRQLLPTFRMKFGKDKKLKIPGLIRWCLDSGMVQQAITVYVERMPDYLISQRKNEFLNISDKSFEGLNIDSHQGKAEAWFSRKLLNMSFTDGGFRGGNGENEIRFIMLVREKSKDMLRVAATKTCSDLPCDEAGHYQQIGINNLIKLVRCIFLDNGTYRCKWRDNVTESDKYLRYFSNYINDDCHQPSAEIFLREFYIPDNTLIKVLCGQMDERYYKPVKGQCTYVSTIENLEELVAKSKDISLKCSVEQMQAILRDYVYLKMLRNMICHATEVNINARMAQEWYLTDPKGFSYNGSVYYYPPLDTITSEQVIEVIKTALEHIKK